MIKKVSCPFSLMSDSYCNYEKFSVDAYIQFVILLCSEMTGILTLNAHAKCNLYFFFFFKVERNQRLKQDKNSKWCSCNLNTNKRSGRINLFVYIRNPKKAFHEVFHMAIKWTHSCSTKECHETWRNSRKLETNDLHQRKWEICPWICIKLSQIISKMITSTVVKTLISLAVSSSVLPTVSLIDQHTTPIQC